LRDFDQLINIVSPQEDVVLSEQLFVVRIRSESGRNYHRAEYASCGPEIQTVVVEFVVNEQFRSLVSSGGHSDIIWLVREVELAQSPINELQLLSVRVDDDISWLDISMHNPLTVTEIQGLQDLEKKIPDFQITQVLAHLSKVLLVDILEYLHS
jgi:hypothetical protein